MKISTQSWHYRIQRIVGTRPAHRSTICEYVRGLFLALFVVSLLASIAGTAGGLIGYAIYTIVTGTFGEGPDILGAAIAGALLVTYGMHQIEKQYSKRQRRKRDEYVAKHGFDAWWQHEYGAKPPGLIRAWLRDKSNKVCSRVDFT